jgi:phosphatidylglycerophosphatase A
MKKILTLMSHGFGLGFSPFAPGTAGTLLGLPIAWALNTHLGWEGQLATGLILSALAIPICQAGEDRFQTKDPKHVVADEYLTFPLCMIGLPVPGQEHGLIVMAFAFLTNRFFDIMKFWPAHGLQRLKGGLGITIDDVFAAFYALAANHAAYALARHLGWL